MKVWLNFALDEKLGMEEYTKEIKKFIIKFEKTNTVFKYK